MKALKKIIPILSILPFIIGTVGYSLAGEKISDALYGSFALYFISPVYDSYNVFVEIARWSAALVTTSAIFYAARRIWLAVVHFVDCLAKDSIAVYSDDENFKIEFPKAHRGVMYLGREFNPAAKSQIIMLASDEESLKFYEEHKSAIKKRKVYIGLRDITPGVLKGSSDKHKSNPDELKSIPDVNFIDIGSAAARMLWKRIALWEQNMPKVKIAILGTGHLGQSILNCGLLMNLFSLDQRIVYYFIGENDLYHISYRKINTFNKDRVCFINSSGIPDIVRTADIVIVSEKISIEKKHTLSVICSGKVYCYQPENGIDDYLKLPNVETFGRNSEIFTDENIRQNQLVSDAIEINYNYLINYPEKRKVNDGKAINKFAEWNALDGFSKWSNIASADFIPVLISLSKKGKDIEELAELEHIRWCRFHILNHWKYGVPKDGENKDEAAKIHKCLCDYAELGEDEKKKDRNGVREVLSSAEKQTVQT